MAESTATYSTGISGFLKKHKPEKKVKEPKLSRKEKKERFRKRLEHLTPEEQRYLKRKRVVDAVWPVFRAVIVIGLCFIILYPLIYMVSAAFRPRAEMNDPTILWIPKTFTMSNIKDAIRAMDFWHTLGNTLVLNIGCSIIQVVTCALTGYGFARFKFKGKNILFFIVIMMILVPSQIILIPQYMFFRYFNPLGIYHAITGNYINLINNAITMYFPAFTANGIRAGLFIFLFRQFFRGLPKELEDAAYLDGCGPFQTFVRIMVPNARTSFLTVFIFSVVWYWNDSYVSGMFYTKSNTVALAIQNLDNTMSAWLNGGTPQGTAADYLVWIEAGCLLSLIPILVMYIFLQKYFVEGLERSGITGM